MQIPSFTSASALSTIEMAKSLQAGAAQSVSKSKTTSPQDPVVASLPPADASITLKLNGLSGILNAQGPPGMSAGQLDSMLQTSLKMQAIRNDASIPPEQKKKLLKPLEQANKDALTIADAKAEQEEKAKILEASNERAAEIREAGEDIAAAREEDEPPIDPADPAITAGSDETADATRTAAAVPTPPRAPVPAAEPLSPVYSTSPPAPAVGNNVDTQA